MLLKRTALLGFAEGDDRSARPLNRIFELKIIDGIPALDFEPDPRHVQIGLAGLGLDGNSCKPVSSPCAAEEGNMDETPLDKAGHSKFRSVAMRFSFLAQDLPTLIFGVKEAARQMHAPTVGSWNRLKRVGRYLKGQPRCVQRFWLQVEPGFLVGKSDSDFAGCRLTRRSTSCALILRGRHLLRCSSTTQKIEGLSSAESEFMALVKCASATLGAKAMAKDLGVDLTIALETDSSAAKAVAQRRGVGKIRHLHTPLLWLQRRIGAGEIKVFMVDGKLNEADVGTKALTADQLRAIVDRLDFVFLEGSSDMELKAALQQFSFLESAEAVSLESRLLASRQFLLYKSMSKANGRGR